VQTLGINGLSKSHAVMRCSDDWAKNEELSDPGDVSAGHIVRFRRSAPDRIVRSKIPAHPTIVSVDISREFS
jgi:hypothetical protein